MDSTSGTATTTCPNCGAGMTEQPRTPSGVPTGGQFAQSERAESGVVLRPVDGSFMYPPAFQSAADVIDFWSRVEIPDEVLAKCQQVHVQNFEFVRDQWPAFAWKTYDGLYWECANPMPDPADVGATSDWEGRKRAAQVDFEEALSARLTQRPEMLNRKDLRPLVRAAGMWLALAEIDRVEGGVVAAVPVELSTGTLTVREAMMETGFAGMANRFMNPEVYDADGDGRIDPPVAPGAPDFDWERHRKIVEETVRGAIAEQNVALDRVFDEMTDNIGKVGAVIMDVNDPRGVRRKK